MQVFADIAVLREQIKQIKREGRRVALYRPWVIYTKAI